MRHYALKYSKSSWKGRLESSYDLNICLNEMWGGREGDCDVTVVAELHSVESALGDSPSGSVVSSQDGKEVRGPFPTPTQNVDLDKSRSKKRVNILSHRSSVFHPEKNKTIFSDP